MKLDDLFAALEAESGPVASSGRLERMVPLSSTFRVFACVRKPDNHRGIRLILSSEAAPDVRLLPRCAGLQLLLEPDTTAGQVALFVWVTDPSYQSVFTALASDIVSWAAEEMDEERASLAILRRLLQWQRLLAAQGTAGLSQEAQRGLYGELRFLRDHLIPIIGLRGAIAAWVGPEAAPRDFQASDWAVEVKTVGGSPHQRLQIASERQLDDSGLRVLFLYHLSVEVLPGAAGTLPELVTSVRAIAEADPLAGMRLEERLLDAGWIDQHQALYAGVGYADRALNLYQVVAGFPRITEAMVPAGVGDVRYSILAASCSSFRIEPSVMAAAIQGLLQ